jgi:hypothetical protein
MPFTGNRQDFWGQVRWFRFIIPAPGKLRQGAQEFEASLGYIERPYLKVFSKYFFFKRLLWESRTAADRS